MFGSSPFQLARDELARIGVDLTSGPGGYALDYIVTKKPGREPLHRAEDLAEAVTVGREMALCPPPPPLPPIGPTGRRKSRKGAMFKHNLKLAARRLRQGLKKS